MWIQFLAHEKSCLDLSSIQLDGSHTPAKRGGEAVGYQGRKSPKPQMLSFSQIKMGCQSLCLRLLRETIMICLKSRVIYQKMLADLQLSDISPDGLFMNADAGFDRQKT
ncbi:hypothetical protein [Saprospira grandis]|uniref:hypothetical protein n=1 Tax=Saprospira grandis TaxID=1008 RepID=UPI0020A2248F|nr:hypothetical protein [Saprospira grandis]